MSEEQELKVVIVTKGQTATIGVQAPGCDPWFRVVQPQADQNGYVPGALEHALAMTPAVVAEANERWAESKRRPKYQGPPVTPPPPVPQRQPAAAATPRPKEPPKPKIVSPNLF